MIEEIQWNSQNPRKSQGIYRVINLLTDNEQSTCDHVSCYRHLCTAIPLPRIEPLDPMQISSHEPDTLLLQERDTRLHSLLRSQI